MAGRPKLLISKEIRYNLIIQYHPRLYSPTQLVLSTHCGRAIVGRIAMTKRKATEQLDHTAKKPNTSPDFVFYESYQAINKIREISHTKIGKRAIFRFLLDLDNQFSPLRCMLDLGSTSIVISPEAAKTFKIPVVKRIKTVKSKDVTGREIETEGLFKISLGLSFGNHWSYNEKIMLLRL